MKTKLTNRVVALSAIAVTSLFLSLVAQAGIQPQVGPTVVIDERGARETKPPIYQLGTASGGTAKFEKFFGSVSISQEDAKKVIPGTSKSGRKQQPKATLTPVTDPLVPAKLQGNS